MATPNEIENLKNDLRDLLEKLKDVKDVHSLVIEEHSEIEEILLDLEDNFEKALEEIGEDPDPSVYGDGDDDEDDDYLTEEEDY